MNETKKLKIGVIGAGWFASRRHIPAIVASKDAELVALCRRNTEQLAKMAQHFGVQNTFTDYREMIDKLEMDGVIITTPHALHYEQAKYCLNKGLHVLIEKPIAITSEDARDLVAIADEKKRIIVVGLNPPYWAYCHFLRAKPLASGVDGLCVVEVIEGAYKAAKMRRAITLETKKAK